MNSPTSEMGARWRAFCERVEAALAQNERTLGSLEVVAVSKYHPAKHIAQHLHELPGFPRTLGENYVQELSQKVADPVLQNLGIQWHFIGALQSRKIADVARLAAVIHSVGREKELRLLASLLKSEGKVPNFYLQFNTSNEGSKNGWDVGEASLARELVTRLGLESHCLGLMTSAAPLESAGELEVRRAFAKLRELRDQHFLRAKLNMGMSADFELAIAEGADLIRVGTLLFGER